MGRAAVFVMVAACALVPSASAIESTIDPGVGVGKVKLGMTRAQVVRALGKDYIVNNRTASSVELAWNFASWAVTLIGNRAVQIAVTAPSQKTPSGAGPGSTWRQLVRAYPHGVCTTAPYSLLGVVEYLVPHKGGTQTIYLLPFRRSVAAGPWRVSEVRVRTPFKRLPEFGPGWQGGQGCRKDWRTADSPV